MSGVRSVSSGTTAVAGEMETEDSASNAASDLDDYWAEADDAIFDASSPTSRKSLHWQICTNVVELAGSIRKNRSRKDGINSPMFWEPNDNGDVAFTFQ